MSPATLNAALQQHQNGQFPAAECLYRQLLQKEPQNASALHLLGVLLHQIGRQDEALDLVHRSIELSPESPHFHCNLASILGKLGRPQEALPHLQTALRLQSRLVEAHNNLGVVLEALGSMDEAISAYRTALELNPAYAECHSNLGNALRKRGMLSQAITEYRKALALKPDYPEAYGNLACSLSELGRLDEALACYRRVMSLKPEWFGVCSDMLFALHYHPDSTGASLLAEHVNWAKRYAEPLYPTSAQYRNDRAPDRRLRIGYISAHLREHPVMRLAEPFFRCHDQSRFEIFCYADGTDPDATTQRLQNYGHTWRAITGLSDEQVAQQVREDGIDILVDLGGHMGRHRLLVFARKPAPVQVSYLGYPDTTGVATIDYRITDSHHDPAGLTEKYHTEQLLRMDPCCWCYQPDEFSPEVNELPALATGQVSFAAFNRPAKTTPAMIRLWSTILQATPDSILLVLVAPGGGGEGAFCELFEQHGVRRDRLVLIGRQTRQDYLKQYHSVDVVLDTFPYNGHTTTLDALWMGVPVVSLMGSTHVARAGLSVLSNAGLGELVADTPEDYVQRALKLASDLKRLAELRQGLRPAMVGSVLRDEAGYTSRLEELYRRVWSKWCVQG